MIGHVLNNMNEIITNEYTNEHQALDIISSDSAESDIISLESGIVEETVKNIPSTDHTSSGLATYGNYVKIRQNDGKTALYAHMKYGTVNVNKGDYVEKGSIIGTMGNTGNAYGNHLHLEIKDQNGNHENPIIELNKNPIEQPIIENKEEIQPVEEIKEETPSTPKTIEEKPEKEIKETPRSQTPTIEYLTNKTYDDGSIVDGLKEINVDSSYEYRQKLAQKNNIKNYHGSYNQNVLMLKMLKEGKLIKA